MIDGLAAAALAGGAALGAYAGLSSQSQWFGSTLTAPVDPHSIALTFDDGPNPAMTPQLLELLARHRVRATFFLIGSYVLREADLARQICALGHSVGNHTMHHLWLPRHSDARIRDEIFGCSRAMEDTLGVAVTLFRPPHGARRPGVIRVARDAGLQVCQWNLMVGDWKPRTSIQLHQRLTAGVAANQRGKRGTCVVLHDGSQHTPTADRTPTLGAVELLLQSFATGFRFVVPPNWTDRG